MFDYERLTLLAIFSKDASLERVAGMKGVVSLILKFVHCDNVIRDFMQAIVLGEKEWQRQPRMTDLCLSRLRLPYQSSAEASAVILMLAHISNMRKYDYDPFCEAMVVRIFDELKDRPFCFPLTRIAYQTYSKFHGKSRFAKQELATINFVDLANEGINITSIQPDLMSMNVILCPESGDPVPLTLYMTNDYPFKSPVVRFTGSNRPTMFATKTEIRIDLYFDYCYAAVEDTLRVILLEMNLNGVTALAPGF